MNAAAADRNPGTCKCCKQTTEDVSIKLCVYCRTDECPISCTATSRCHMAAS